MKGFVIALQFLTRIRLVRNLEINEEDFGSSSRFFPLVGLVIGLILSLVAYSGSKLFQPLTLAVFIIVAEIILTGGIHLDGFMDSCDGLFSGRSRDRMLEIMKDSRVGAMGVLGLVTLFMLKLALLMELTAQELYLVLPAMTVLSRWIVVYALIRYPYARREGMGGFFHGKISRRSFLLVTLYSVILVMVISPANNYPAIGGAVIAALLVGKGINNKLQGHTGDTYGMLCELTEVMFLLLCVLSSKIN